MSTALAAVLVTSMRLVSSHGYADGAPPGFSGGFKQESCHACHFHEAPNAGPGRVTLQGVPATFAAGERYTLAIALTGSGMKRAGFQLVSRFADGGAQAGALAPGPGEAERVAIDNESGLQYAGQRLAGTAVGSADTAAWTVVWTAPDRGGAVTFHVAANAANGDGSAEGDFVYTAIVESAPPP